VNSKNCTTFVRITNIDIYNKLCEVETHVKNTNGKVKRNYWIATTALLVSLGLGLFLLQSGD
jgi:hypothetical protein